MKRICVTNHRSASGAPGLRLLVAVADGSLGRWLRAQLRYDAMPQTGDQPAGTDRAAFPVHRLSTAQRMHLFAIPGNFEQAVYAWPFQAHAVVLSIRAGAGGSPETLRTMQLAAISGIRHLIVAIDVPEEGDSAARTFEAIRRKLEAAAHTQRFLSVSIIPLGALDGDHAEAWSVRPPWYAGPSLRELLATLSEQIVEDDRFVFVTAPGRRTHIDLYGVTGTVLNGTAGVGDQVRMATSGKTAIVSDIVAGDGGMATLILDRELGVESAAVLTLSHQPAEATDQFEATVVWLHGEEGMTGRSYQLRLAGQEAHASITTIKYRINPTTQAHEASRSLQRHDIAVCNIAAERPLAYDTIAGTAMLGSFTLVDRYTGAKVGAGFIRHPLRRSQNVHRQALTIGHADRERLNGHQGKAIWFTGLSGSGKSTLANTLEVALHARGIHTYLLDGDNIRHGLNKDLGFSDADRVENIRRIAEVTKLMVDAGMVVMTAFISPFIREREMAREMIGADRFIEIYVSTPLEVCTQRDVKGLYKKAREGLLPNMTGVNSPYEPPPHPDFEANTTTGSAHDIVGALLDFVIDKL